MSDYYCDGLCGESVPDGSGHYPDDNLDLRLCAQCYEDHLEQIEDNKMMETL